MSKNKAVLQTNLMAIPQISNMHTLSKDYLLKTPILNKQCRLDMDNLNITQSHFVQIQYSRLNHCPSCLIYKKKFIQLQSVLIQVNSLKKKNQQVKEEIQLLTSNFMYILELASQNIVKGLKQKVKNVIQEKQKIIKKQAQFIKKLENQSDILIDKVDAGLETSQKISELQEKIKVLQAENLTLKGIKSISYQEEIPSIVMNSTDVYTFQSGQTSPKQPLNNLYHFSSMDLGRQKLNSSPKKTLRILKRNTMQTTEIKPQETYKIKSLDNLKTKINSIKQKLINEKF